MKIIFWLGIAVPAYTYIAYPLLLLLLGMVIRRPVRKGPLTPTVSLLVPAYNEAGVIARKVRNSLAINYPAGKLDICIACDGSRDGTPEIARAASGTSVRVLEFPENRGKLATLNDLARRAKGEILVFSDASSMLDRDSIRQLVQNFADPQVGAVSGKYKIVKPEEVDIGASEDFYWKYETWLKTRESHLCSILGSHGHLHAIRRALYPFPPPGTINDDFVIAFSVISKGLRAVYEPQALGYEEARDTTGFRRRVRIMAGNVQQIREIRGLLAPLRPLALFLFLSHKVVRLLVPFAMLAALAANLRLLGEPAYLALLWAQGLFFLLAALGARCQLKPRVLRLPFYFCMIHVATFFGLYQTLTSRRKIAWK